MNKKVNKKILFISYLIILLLVILFYKGENSDWKAYRFYVENCTGIGSTYFEILYDYLNYIASISIGFYLIPIFSISVFILVIYKYFIDYKNDNILLVFKISVLFAYLPLLYGALRQSIAFSFLLLVIYYLVRKNYFKTLLYSLLSIGFHNSSLVIIFLVIFYFILYKFSNKKINVFIIFSILSAIIGMFFINIIYEKLKIIPSFNAGTQSVAINNTKLIILPIERFIILVFALILLKNIPNNYKNYYLILLSFIGSLFYLLMFKFSLNTAGRIAAFFRSFDLIVLYYFFKYLFSILVKKKIIFVNERVICMPSILIILIYSIIKYYFTIISVGYYS